MPQVGGQLSLCARACRICQASRWLSGCLSAAGLRTGTWTYRSGGRQCIKARRTPPRATAAYFTFCPSSSCIAFAHLLKACSVVHLSFSFGLSSSCHSSRWWPLLLLQSTVLLRVPLPPLLLLLLRGMGLYVRWRPRRISSSRLLGAGPSCPCRGHILVW